MRKIRAWKSIFAICCIVYIGWVIHVGGNEFDRINGQYRMIIQQLEPGRIKTAAVEELTEECRRVTKWQTGLKMEDCFYWPPPLVENKKKEIEERLTQAKKRGTIKVLLFYAGFVLIFLLTPPVLIYLFIAGILKLKENIEIVR
jgi:hypothetical protein